MVPSVLVVDDDPDFLGLAARILKAMGIEQILTAPNAAAAMAQATAHRPHAALIDVGLPDRSGIDLGHELARLAWAPRVVLTSTDRDAVNGLEPPAGAAPLPFLPKEDLAEAKLRELLEST